MVVWLSCSGDEWKWVRWHFVARYGMLNSLLCCCHESLSSIVWGVGNWLSGFIQLGMSIIHLVGCWYGIGIGLMFGLTGKGHHEKKKQENLINLTSEWPQWQTYQIYSGNGYSVCCT